MKGNLELSSRSLEALVCGADTPPEIAEKALFQLARVYELMDLGEAACEAYRRYADAYPDSDAAAKARTKAGRIR